RGAATDERQRVRTDGGHLLRGCAARGGARGFARDRDGVSEPLRLSRSRPRVDRSQEFRARLHIVAGRLRTAHAAQVFSLQDIDMTTGLRGNWNYPTTIWAGPGRVAELSVACSRAGIRRPLPVTDEGLTG